MKSQGIQRRVQLELPGFLGLAAIVSSTDLVATVPRTIAEKLAQTASIVIHPCPVKVPTFMVSQYWHARYHHDPGVRWLRGLCVKLFSRVEHPRAKAPPHEGADSPGLQQNAATRAAPARTAPRRRAAS